MDSVELANCSFMALLALIAAVTLCVAGFGLTSLIDWWKTRKARWGR